MKHVGQGYAHYYRGPVDKRIETISEHSRHHAKQGFKIDNQIMIV